MSIIGAEDIKVAEAILGTLCSLIFYVSIQLVSCPHWKHVYQQHDQGDKQWSSTTVTLFWPSLIVSHTTVYINGIHGKYFWIKEICIFNFPYGFPLQSKNSIPMKWYNTNKQLAFI